MNSTYSIPQAPTTPTANQVLGRLPELVNDDGTLGLIMELSGKLQTTLEVDTLIELFAQVIQEAFQYDTLSYHSQDGETIQLGEQTGRNKLDYKLKVLDSELGTILITRRKRFDKGEIAQIENLLAALLYPLRNALLYRAALRCAIFDSLTGVKNRTAFDSNFRRDMEINRRNLTDLSIIVLDIDFFKRFNDRYGHAVGDLVLQQVAKTVEQTIRGSDALYRVGGEEFVVVLNATDLKGAKLLAERIRERVAGLNIEGLKNTKVTLSLGVSLMRENDIPQSLFERADLALYQAKRGGRDQVAAA
ncbi:MAG: GGDEF domain-containing protein [Candidatus Thiodiazotropha sp.]|jgi:diguanylate cyclase (GGDEF)-like protein